MSAPSLLIPVCVLAAGAVLSSCASRRGSEEGEKSAGALPGAYSRASGEMKKNAPGAGWWKRFGSRELDSLIEEARANSFDVAASLARVEQARARTRIASAALLPEVSASAGVDQAGRSGSGETSYVSGLSAGYEVDLWAACAPSAGEPGTSCGPISLITKPRCSSSRGM